MRCCDCPHKHTNNDDEPDIKLIDDKVRSHKKKRYYLGIFPKRRTPPPPPLLGTPYPKKNFSVYFAF